MQIHNNVLEALDQANIGEDFDIWCYVPELQDSYLKFFKAYKKRCSNVIAHYRVLPVNEGAPTTGPVTGIATTWQKRTKLAKQQHSTVRLEFNSSLITNSNTTSWKTVTILLLFKCPEI